MRLFEIVSRIRLFDARTKLNVTDYDSFEFRAAGILWLYFHFLFLTLVLLFLVYSFKNIYINSMYLLMLIPT